MNRCGIVRVALALSVLASMSFLTPEVAQAFIPKHHKEITERALGPLSFPVGNREFRFTKEAIQEIADANVHVDDGTGFTCALRQRVGPGAVASYHMTDETLSQGSLHLLRLRDAIRKALRPQVGNPCDGEAARRVLGSALHTVQDFYSHSNWIQTRGPVPSTALGRLLLPPNVLDQDFCDDSRSRYSPNPFGLLTSGYFAGDCGGGNAALGKCNHGRTLGLPNPGTAMDDDSFDRWSAPGRSRLAREVAEISTADYVRTIVQDLIDDNNTVGLATLTGATGSLGFVVDITGSAPPTLVSDANMVAEMPHIREMIRNAVLQSTLDPQRQPAQYYLTTHAVAIGPSVFTTAIPEEMLAEVARLGTGTSGSGACGVGTCGAILASLEVACDGGVCHVFTDRGARDAARASATAAVAREKRIRIKPWLSGTCSPIDPAYIRMAEGTGGSVQLFDNEQIARASQPLAWEASGGMELIDAARVNRPTGLPYFYISQVDATVTSLRYSVHVPTGGTFVLRRPDNSLVAPNEPGVTWVTSLQTTVVLVDQPATGEWTVQLAGTGEAWFHLEGKTPLGIRRFAASDEPGGPHPGYLPIGRSVQANVPFLLIVQPSGPWGEILNMEVAPIDSGLWRDAAMTTNTLTAEGELVATGTSPGPGARVRLVGRTPSGDLAQRLSREVLDVAPFSLTLEDRESGFVGPCAETSVVVRLDGPPGVYTLSADGVNVSASDVSPGQVTLTAERPSASVRVTYRVQPSGSRVPGRPWLVVAARETSAPGREITRTLPVHAVARDAGAAWVSTRRTYPPRADLFPRPGSQDLIVLTNSELSSTPSSRFEDALVFEGGAFERRRELRLPARSGPLVWCEAPDRIVQIAGSGRHRVFNGHSWTDEPVTGGIPPAASVVYDRARGTIIAFGGRSATTPVDSTLEFVGGRWEVRQPANKPSARSFAQLTYDPVRERVVLYGGYGSGGVSLRDTWEWDGTDWTLVHGAGPVLDSGFSQLAYAGYGGLGVVLLSARTPNQPSTPPGLWAWDGNTWARQDRFGPSPGVLGVARDPATSRLIALSGGGLVRLDPDRWTTLLTGGAAFYEQTCAVYDSVRRHVVVHSSNVTSERAADGWRQFTYADLGLPRDGYSMAFDSNRGRSLIFGGITDSFPTNNTWERIDGVWQRAIVPTRPSARAGHAMVYDAAAGRTVLFGGSTGGFAGPALGDTWLYDGTTWALASSSGPPPRYAHALAFDPVRRRVVLFGGVGTNGTSPTLRGDTWEWDGAVWVLAASAGPPPRSHHAMAFDPARGKVVLFGGDTSLLVKTFGSAGEPYRDTWEWDGSTWTLQSPGGLGGRVNHALVFDESRGRLLLVGGSGDYDVYDEYEWVSNDASLTITPGDTDVRLGKAIVMGVDVPIDVPGITYRWRRDGEALQDGPSVSGATTAFLTVQPANLFDGGFYQCERTTGCGMMRSNPIRVRVLCPSDLDDGSGSGLPDEGVTIEDLLYFIDQYGLGALSADVDDGSATGSPDGGVTIDDLLYYLFRFNDGC